MKKPGVPAGGGVRPSWSAGSIPPAVGSIVDRFVVEIDEPGGRVAGEHLGAVEGE
jgi:hypothetical protein